MLFTVYILYSDLMDQYYIGHTSDIDERLYRQPGQNPVSGSDGR